MDAQTVYYEQAWMNVTNASSVLIVRD